MTTALTTKEDKASPESTEKLKQKLEDLLLKCEARALRSFPLEVFRAFQALLQQYIPRVALLALALHVVMLIPTLKYIKKVLVGVDIIPFIYLGPIVFILPFIGLWLWENNVVEISHFDDKLVDFVRGLQNKSITALDSNEGKDLNENLRRCSTDIIALRSVEEQITG